MRARSCAGRRCSARTDRSPSSARAGQHAGAGTGRRRRSRRVRRCSSRVFGIQAQVVDAASSVVHQHDVGPVRGARTMRARGRGRDAVRWTPRPLTASTVLTTQPTSLLTRADAARVTWLSSRSGFTGASLRLQDRRVTSLVARGGVEPPTFRFSVGRSYQLSYLAVPSWAGGNHTREPGAPDGIDRREAFWSAVPHGPYAGPAFVLAGDPRRHGPGPHRLAA